MSAPGADPSAPSDYTADFRNRTALLLGPDVLRFLDGKTVGIAGCGGVGGAAAIMLARVGVGGFVLADPGLFDPPDMNRQWGAARSTLGVNKALTYERLVHDINPAARIRTFREGVTPDTMEEIVRSCDFLVDCLDVQVQTPLRMAMYKEAQRAGIYCATSPVVGFGTLMMVASPGGLGIDPQVQALIDELRNHAKLPSGFSREFFPAHVERLEANISRGVASIAMGPAMGATLVCGEVLAALLHGHFPGFRAPICLPEVVVAELVQPNYRVAHCRDLFPNVRVGGDDALTEASSDGDAARAERLAAAGYSTVALSPDDVALDLLTDSWDEPGQSARPSRAATLEDVSRRLREVYPYRHVEPATRGRFAEALLAEALVRPGARVLANALFPTTHYHLTTRGAVVTRVDREGEIDFDELERELGRGDVAAVYLELAANALCGQPIAVQTLSRAHALAREKRVPLVLDACRAFANAELLRAREGSSRDLGSIVRDLLGSSDACAASLSKDFASPIGGFVGTNDDALAARVRLASRVMYASPPAPSECGRILASLRSEEAAITARAAFTSALAADLESISVPLLGPRGSHAIFVDASALLPHVAVDLRPADTLAAALYIASGVRAARNLVTPGDPSGACVLRLAVRTDRCQRDHHDRVVRGFERVLASKGSIRGLRAEVEPGEPGERLLPA